MHTDTHRLSDTQLASPHPSCSVSVQRNIAQSHFSKKSPPLFSSLDILGLLWETCSIKNPHLTPSQSILKTWDGLLNSSHLSFQTIFAYTEHKIVEKECRLSIFKFLKYFFFSRGNPESSTCQASVHPPSYISSSQNQNLS